MLSNLPITCITESREIAKNVVCQLLRGGFSLENICVEDAGDDSAVVKVRTGSNKENACARVLLKAAGAIFIEDDDAPLLRAS